MGRTANGSANGTEALLLPWVSENGGGTFLLPGAAVFFAVPGM
jgi:hypothetical protein